MSTARLVNLGLPKSGTTTVEVALRKAELRIADWKIRAWDCDDDALVGHTVARIMYDDFYEHGDPLKRLDAFDAFTEISVINLKRGVCLWPQTDFGIIDAIYRLHPEVKFVASWRPPEKIADSMRRWNNLGKVRMPNGPVPGLPVGYGGDEAQLARWIETHYAHIDCIFAGDERFLRLDVTSEDAPKRLSRFLGIEIGWWGKANENLNRPADDDEDDDDATDEKASGT